MFEMFKVYTRTELQSRTEIALENYSKVINIEALTMLEMAKKQILPAGLEFAKSLSEAVAVKNESGIDASLEKKLANRVTALNIGISDAIDELDAKLIGAGSAGGVQDTAVYYRRVVFASMQSLRAVADELETITPEKLWPFPTYGDLLFRV